MDKIPKNVSIMILEALREKIEDNIVLLPQKDTDAIDDAFHEVEVFIDNFGEDQ
jgi:hypothetical protein